MLRSHCQPSHDSCLTTLSLLPLPAGQSLHALGLNVVCDVVYNHTFAAGPWSHNTVLDKVVPGYYHRWAAQLLSS
jgi:hypothetical protein